LMKKIKGISRKNIDTIDKETAWKQMLL
jgi:hypothetical protein